MVRLHAEQMTKIDAWIVRQDKPVPSRPEAIRRLAELGLVSDEARHPMPKKSAGRAQAIAAKALDFLVDKSAPTTEQARRKQRLLKGPPEFREIRKPKGRAK